MEYIFMNHDGVWDTEKYTMKQMFKKDTTVKYENKKVDEILSYIDENKNNANKCIIFHSHSRSYNEVKILDYISQYDSECFLLKIVFFIYDFWPKNISPYKDAMTRLIKVKNHYLFTFASDVERLSIIWNDNKIRERSHKIICDDLCCAYPLSFVEYNMNPKMKIALSGSHTKLFYPERALMYDLSKQNKNIEVMAIKKESDSNMYSRRLSQYICCFATSVFINHTKESKIRSTNTIPMKVYEILASGSLLLYPRSEEKYLNEIGIYNNVNCILCDISEPSINKMIDYILDANNRKTIDNIRKRGQEHAEQNLNMDVRYQQIKDKIRNYIE